MNKDLLIESLNIAKDNFDFDGEYDKSDQIHNYLIELINEE